MDNLKEKALSYNINNSDIKSNNNNNNNNNNINNNNNNFRYVSFSESLEDIGYQNQYTIDKDEDYYIQEQRYIRQNQSDEGDEEDYNNNYEDSIKISLIQKSFIKNKKNKIIITTIVVLLMIMVSVGLILAWQGVFDQIHSNSNSKDE
ncbi:hypothetical protein ACTFIU_009610 [Dictyostelium citrinum]